MGALFGLEGGFVTNRYRKRRPRQVRFPADSNRIAGASTQSEKCQQRTPFATPSCRFWRAPPAVLGLIATLLADRDRISAY
jgi:hypothetical protein